MNKLPEKITRRTNNLGFSYTNETVTIQHNGKTFVKDPPRQPSIVGSPRQILEAYYKARSENLTNDWKYAFHIGKIYLGTYPQNIIDKYIELLEKLVRKEINEINP